VTELVTKTIKKKGEKSERKKSGFKTEKARRSGISNKEPARPRKKKASR